MNSFTLVTLLCLFAAVFADTFIHGCMEGSNNKLNEQRNDADRNNANRLFDSENGAGGGYYSSGDDTGQVDYYRKYYYVGSQLHLQWTNQHGSGANAFIRTNFVWQYLCNNIGGGDATPWDLEGPTAGGSVRDGRTTNTINYAANGAGRDDTNNGRHESWDYYHACVNRQRNQGLYTSDQNLNGNTAQYTRQNPAGSQYGYECSEERDYYPYWHPTPFVDIVYLTSTPDAEDGGGCESIKANSFNSRSYSWCDDIAHNNEDACNAAGATWSEYGPLSAHYDFILEPECQESAWSRENALGTGLNGRMNSYNWTIPDNPGATCALRLRYNMTQGEIAWNLDHKSNDDQSPVQERDNNGGANDNVPNFAGSQYPNIKLYIAVNTDQFPRAFQDRTHLFEIRERPADVDPRALIFNLGNKGGRGNLQDIYPMVENDFCPEFMVVRRGDFIHFQLHGPNYGDTFNRNQASGAGRTGANRANRVNLIQIEKPSDNFPMRPEDQTLFDNEDTAILAAMIGQNPADCNANQNAEQANDNCGKLNASDHGYVDIGLLKMNRTGTFHFISSRNNHNTNRAQKGTLIVEPALSWVAILLIVLASVLAAGAAGVGVMAQQAKSNPGGRAAQLWDRMASAGGSSFGGSYRY